MNPEIIQAAYYRDRLHNRVAVTADDLPLSFEAITDGWLTAVLCDKAPDAAVTAHRLGAIDTGTSNRRRIFVDYNAAGVKAGLPAAMFCKASQDLANRIVLGVSGAARCETLFYTQVRPLLDIEAPMCHYARFDPESFNSMIILDDLTDTAQAFCNHKTVITRQRAESQMRLLAKVHGSCYGNEALRERIAGFPTFKEFFTDTLGFGMREGSEAGFLAGAEVIPQRLYQRAAAIWPATLAAVDALDHGPRTLGHGDVHLKNWYVAGNGEMGLADWQCCSLANWGRDFAYTIATALTAEDRRAWERELLAYYLEQLAAAGGPAVAFDAAWDIYRQQLIPALTWWTVTLCPTPDIPDMQPRDVTLEFIQRIATAMDDLDSLSL
ncbi:MAG: hypothetical protein JWQ90_848 [Hydrocarboniphaga sp.]|uniref:phosphotransferase n=1 Tax=Hydrocarboniphaga sp. TaxID=2033016 RepID=UPI002610AB5D|nr:phosphotransferase [Hydrocarboniphaga sp.]MDB5968398.1 hypothetical protein [Hydrocarboniphaga sp.]